MTDKQMHIIGEDGKLYFTYALGAVYKLSPIHGEPFYYEIVDIEFDAESETEYYRIESAGKQLPTRFSVPELEALLERLPSEQVEEGEAVELPLLREEVAAFFKAKNKERNKANVEANKALKGTSFYKNLSLIKSTKEELSLSRAQGKEEKTAELEKKLSDLEEEQTKILNEKGIDRKVLIKVPDCPLCDDSGIIGTTLCFCTTELAEQIKTFNAELRLLSLSSG